MRRDVVKNSLETEKGVGSPLQLYKQNLEDNFEPYETKRPQPS